MNSNLLILKLFEDQIRRISVKFVEFVNPGSTAVTKSSTKLKSLEKRVACEPEQWERISLS
jgi:hypothetical protein